MFSNIGGKIKLLSKILCWVGIALSIILGVVILTSGETVRVTLNGDLVSTSNVPAGIIMIVGGSLLSWISSLFAYGFGQLIENTDSIRDGVQRKA